MSGCNSPAPHTTNNSVDLLEKDTVEWVDQTQIIDSAKASNKDILSKNGGGLEKNPKTTAPNIIPIKAILGEIDMEIEAMKGLITMGDVDFGPDDSTNTPKPFYAIETQPEFPRGLDSLKLFIVQNTPYPKKAKKAEVQGKVYVSFIIDKEGAVKEPKIARGVSPSLDSAALHTISKLPHWKPGENQGKKVDVEFTIPVNFKLKH